MIAGRCEAAILKALGPFECALVKLPLTSEQIADHAIVPGSRRFLDPDADEICLGPVPTGLGPAVVVAFDRHGNIHWVSHEPQLWEGMSLHWSKRAGQRWINFFG